MKLVIELDLDAEGKACPGAIQHGLRDIARCVYAATGVDPFGESDNPNAIRDLRELHYGVHFGGDLIADNKVWAQYVVVPEPFVEKTHDGPMRAHADPGGDFINVKPN